jgi:hypothetical protein
MQPVILCGTEAAALRRRRWLAHSLLIAAVMFCILLALCPPDRYGFYPRCPIHRILGIECPGCGSTRALAALLHGHLLEALRCNALFVLLLPAALPCAMQLYRRALRAGDFLWPEPPVSSIYAAFAVTALFTVARNLVR